MITTGLSFAQAVSNNIPKQMAARVNVSSASPNDKNQSKDNISMEAINAIQNQNENFTFLHAIMEIKTIFTLFPNLLSEMWKSLLIVQILQTS
ncbi:hypothetical protein TNCT_235071 [Trichonephila clavata]|uniref:Uncharacterized protein n=1 Tax=Trichonephila clavata TaxID=2740835 RepID=A0A8X6L811_TRICU|nr:hypothetical protein TNCT_235071 [Trichonephila clavata]